VALEWVTRDRATIAASTAFAEAALLGLDERTSSMAPPEAAR